MVYINFLIVNILIWVGISYFWSFWTYKVFKPWAWLEMHKRKLISKKVESLERKCKDRVRLHTIFFAMEQIERQEVPGELAVLGVENEDTLIVLREQCPERTIRAVGIMAPSDYTIVRENCQGEISEEVVALDYVDVARVREILPDGDRCIVRQGKVSEGAAELNGPVALAIIDSVDHDEVLSALRSVYPLLSKGGMIIVHSYNHDWAGVTKAVDTFAASISEGFIPVADMYGSVIMIKNNSF